MFEMKMRPRLSILLTVVMMITQSLAQSQCCDEKNLTVSGCAVSDIILRPNGHFWIRRQDGKEFSAELSIVNLVPRTVSKGYDVNLALNPLQVAFTKGNDTFVFKRDFEGKERRIYSEDEHLLLPECNTSVPLVMRRLFNCDMKTHSRHWFLHHVGTFYSRDRTNSTVVGYYRRHGDPGTDGWKTRAIAWTESGVRRAEQEYLDHSNTTSLTGWQEKDGRELVVSVNSFGHMCFFNRSYDSLQFRPPGADGWAHNLTWANKFMPHCVPANMLFGCPQSFCFTGLVDEIVESVLDLARLIGTDSKTVTESRTTFIRGNYMYPAVNQSMNAGYTLDHRNLNVSLTENSAFGGWTVAATAHLPDGGEMFFMENEKGIFARKYVLDWDHYAETGNLYRTMLLPNGGNWLGSKSSLPLPVTAMYFNESSKQFHVFSDKEHVTFETSETDLTANIVARSDNKAHVDAMFQLDGIVYQKSGQFFWEASPVVGSPKRQPILRHYVYSPAGIVSIDHCGWDWDELKQLFRRIKAANETWSQMLPIDAVSEDYPPLPHHYP